MKLKLKEFYCPECKKVFDSRKVGYKPQYVDSSGIPYEYIPYCLECLVEVEERNYDIVG